MENTQGSDELRPAAPWSPETPGDGHRANSRSPVRGAALMISQVETLKLGPWTLQGACKSTVTQSTMEGPLESVSAAFSISQGDRGPRKAEPTALGGGTQAQV